VRKGTKKKGFKKSMLKITCTYVTITTLDVKLKNFSSSLQWCMFKSRQTLCLVITAGCTQPLFFHWVPLHSVVCLRKWLFTHWWMSEMWKCRPYVLPALTVITSRAEGAKLHHSAFRIGILLQLNGLDLWLLSISVCDEAWQIWLTLSEVKFYKSLCDSLKNYII